VDVVLVVDLCGETLGLEGIVELGDSFVDGGDVDL
jgi:hypothetical protein